MTQELEVYRHLNPMAIILTRFSDETQVSKYWAEAQTLPAHVPSADKVIIDQIIAGELAKLQVAYPSQIRNYSPEEVAATCALWTEIFGRVHPQVFHEAVQRFILNDRKGFFPTPGQVVKYVEDIIKEVREIKHRQESYERMKRTKNLF